MPLQRKPRESSAKFSLELLHVEMMLKAKHEIVGVADDDMLE